MLSLSFPLTSAIWNINFIQDVLFGFFDKHFLLNNPDNKKVFVHHQKKKDPYILSTDVFSEILRWKINSNNQSNNNSFTPKPRQGPGRLQDIAAPHSGNGDTWQGRTGSGSAGRQHHAPAICRTSAHLSC